MITHFSINWFYVSRGNLTKIIIMVTYILIEIYKIYLKHLNILKLFYTNFILYIPVFNLYL